MAIGYVNAANTFQQWLISTQDLITVANNLTDNIAGTFYANTNLVAGNTLIVVGDTTISGNLTVSGNITLDALGFDDSCQWFSHNCKYIISYRQHHIK